MPTTQGFPHSSPKRCIDEPCEPFVVWPCYREDNLGPKLGAQPKLYYTDPVYASFDAGLHARRIRPGTAPPHGKEIDFVGPQVGGIAFESKYVDGGWRRDALTLKASRWQGVVATRSEIDLSDPDVAAVPVAMLAWLLDS